MTYFILDNSILGKWENKYSVHQPRRVHISSILQLPMDEYIVAGCICSLQASSKSPHFSFLTDLCKIEQSLNFIDLSGSTVCY